MEPYDEIVEFIASRNPREVIEFRPSEAAARRVWDLIERNKDSALSSQEEAELKRYLELEHLMRLAKARAQQLLSHEQGH